MIEYLEFQSAWGSSQYSTYGFTITLTNSKHVLKWVEKHETVEPWFHEVPKDWGNLFVISRVRYIQYLHLTNFRKNYQNVHYIEVKLIINLQNLAFSDLKFYCNNISVPSYT